MRGNFFFKSLEMEADIPVFLIQEETLHPLQINLSISICDKISLLKIILKNILRIQRISISLFIEEVESDKSLSRDTEKK